MFNKPIQEMNFEDLRDAFQILYDAFSKQSREYADLLENLDFENFSPEVSKEIKSTVSDEKLGMLAETVIKQTADAISTYASRQVNIKDAVEVNKVSQMTNTSLVYKIGNYSEEGKLVGETYYYYNPLIKDWEAMSGDTIFTLFEQTANGFEFRGNVVIDGNFITKGTISAKRINTDELSCTKLYSREGKHFAKMNSQYGDFGVFLSNASESETAVGDNCIWGVMNTDPGTGAVNFYIYGTNYLGYNKAQDNVYPKGTWDFANAKVENLGLPLVFS